MADNKVKEQTHRFAHLIEFRKDGNLKIEGCGTITTCQIRRGVQCPANVRCYVISTSNHYTEIADVEVAEGILRGIPCSCFMFIDRMD